MSTHSQRPAVDRHRFRSTAVYVGTHVKTYRRCLLEVDGIMIRWKTLSWNHLKLMNFCTCLIQWSLVPVEDVITWFKRHFHPQHSLGIIKNHDLSIWKWLDNFCVPESPTKSQMTSSSKCNKDVFHCLLETFCTQINKVKTKLMTGNLLEYLLKNCIFILETYSPHNS